MRHFLLKLRCDFRWTLYQCVQSWSDAIYYAALKAEDDYAESAMAKNSAYWNFVDNAEHVVTGHVTLPDGESIPIVQLVDDEATEQLVDEQWYARRGDVGTWAEQEQARYS